MIVDRYMVLEDGDIIVTHECNLSPFLPPPARVGCRLAIPGRFSRLEWLGKGPSECYSDRETGCKVDSECNACIHPY